MDPQRPMSNLPPAQPLPPPRRSQAQVEHPFPTALSPISPLPCYPPRISNPISATASGPAPASQYLSNQSASTSPNQLRSTPSTTSSTSPNQPFSRPLAPTSASPSQPFQNQNPPGQLHHKSSPSPLSLSRHRTQVTQSPVSSTTSPTASLLGQYSPNQPAYQLPGFSNRLSPSQYALSQLPHPSQLPPNQWPTRSSFSDQGSPSSMSRSLSSNSSINPTRKVKPNTNPNPSPRTGPIPMTRSISSPAYASIHTPAPNFIHNPVPTLALTTVPNLGAIPVPIVQQPALLTPPPAGGGGGSSTSGNPHVNLYVAQVERHFTGQPILFFEFLFLLKKLGAGE